MTICHIFTGNDYNPSFYRKGKKKPFDILKKQSKFQVAFIDLLNITPSEMTTSNSVFRIIEEFVCKLYSLKSNDVNLRRLELFEKAFSNKNHSDKIIKSKLKGLDASSMPPSKEELLQQIKRTTYISNVWCNASMRCPTNLKPENCGWTLTDNKYHHYWFDGPQSPSFEDISSNVTGMRIINFI